MIFLEDTEIKSLVLQLKEGSEPALNRLYADLAKTLYRKILKLVKDDHLAEEILQDLFIKIWQKRTELNPELSFKAYVHKIAQNLVYDYMRKAASNRRLTERLLLNAVDFYVHIEEGLIQKETSEIINQAIQQLTPQRRQAFILCKVEGKSYAEAAEQMGISIATINSHMVKSLRFIKDFLDSNQDVALLFIISLTFFTGIK